MRSFLWSPPPPPPPFQYFTTHFDTTASKGCANTIFIHGGQVGGGGGGGRGRLFRQMVRTIILLWLYLKSRTVWKVDTGWGCRCTSWCNFDLTFGLAIMTFFEFKIFFPDYISETVRCWML